MPSCSRRTTLCTVSAIFVGGLAGCGSRTTTNKTSTDRCSTYTSKGTASTGFDLGILNRDDRLHAVTVVVDYKSRSGAETVFEREFVLDPGEEDTSTCLPFFKSGIYTISISLDSGQKSTFEWNIEQLSETTGKAIFVTISEDATISFDWFYV